MKLLDMHKRLNRTLVLDGAMGSLLEIDGHAKRDKLWSARCNYECPDVVERVHNNYIKAGANIIRTNTFRTNPAAINDNYLSSKELVAASVQLAQKAAARQDVLIAGSNPPAEDCYQTARKISNDELQKNHELHINNLIDAGVDIIWNETFSQIDEIRIVAKYCESLKKEYVLSLFLTSDLHLLSGENYLTAIENISRYNPTAIGFNCFSVNVFDKLMHELNPEFNFGFYLNCGQSSVTDEHFTNIIDERHYAESITKYILFNPIFIGSCCGSNPKHTKSIKEVIT